MPDNNDSSKILITHRIYRTLKEEQSKGKKDFILYGNNVYFDLFYDLTFYHKDSVESLAIQIFQDKIVDNILIIEEDKIYSFSIENDIKIKKEAIPNNKIIEFIGGKIKNNSTPFNPLNENRDNENSNADNTIEQMQESRLSIAFTLITKALQETNKSTAVIIKGIEWIAELFEGKDHQIDYLKEIEKWWQITNSDAKHYSYIITKSYDQLKKYFNIEDDDDKLIYVGGPTIKEMEDALSHKLKNDPKVSGRLNHKAINKALKLIQNNDLSLRDFLALYDDIAKDSQINMAEEDKLIREIEKRLDSAIDEEVIWKNVVLNDDTKKKIESELDSFQKSIGQSKKGTKGILFYGPPGTGKTMIAKALANKGGFFFSAPKLAELKGEYVGQSAPKVKKLFDEARANSPTLIFLDELDALFPKRGGQNTDSYSADITNQFLAEVDGVDTGRQDIFVIGATNRIDIIDDAIMSRLSKVEIDLPCDENRKKLFEIHLKEIFNTFEKDQKANMIQKSKGLSGRDIKNISAAIESDLKDGKNNQTAITNAFLITRKNLADKFQNNSLFDITLFDENNSGGLESIIGFDHEKKVLKNIVDTMNHSKRFVEFGLSNYNGVLMYGPPGNGKSIFAIALAREYKLDFVKVIGSSLAVGSVDSAIRIFEDIVRNVLQLSPLNPLLLFFDEFDGIAHAQMDSKLRSVILDRINVLRSNGNVIIMAATNYYERIDEAVKRAGRFDEHLIFDNPTQEDIIKLITFFTGHEKFDNSQINPKSILSKILQSEKTVSISKVKTLCDDAKRNALMKNPDLNEKIILKDEYFGI